MLNLLEQGNGLLVLSLVDFVYIMMGAFLLHGLCCTQAA